MIFINLSKYDWRISFKTFGQIIFNMNKKLELHHEIFYTKLNKTDFTPLSILRLDTELSST